MHNQPAHIAYSGQPAYSGYSQPLGHSEYAPQQYPQMQPLISLHSVLSENILINYQCAQSSFKHALNTNIENGYFGIFMNQFLSHKASFETSLKRMSEQIQIDSKTPELYSQLVKKIVINNYTLYEFRSFIAPILEIALCVREIEHERLICGNSQPQNSDNLQMKLLKLNHLKNTFKLNVSENINSFRPINIGKILSVLAFIKEDAPDIYHELRGFIQPSGAIPNQTQAINSNPTHPTHQVPFINQARQSPAPIQTTYTAPQVSQPAYQIPQFVQTPIENPIHPTNVSPTDIDPDFAALLRELAAEPLTPLGQLSELDALLFSPNDQNPTPMTEASSNDISAILGASGSQNHDLLLLPLTSTPASTPASIDLNLDDSAEQSEAEPPPKKQRTSNQLDLELRRDIFELSGDKHQDFHTKRKSTESFKNYSSQIQRALKTFFELDIANHRMADIASMLQVDQTVLENYKQNLIAEYKKHQQEASTINFESIAQLKITLNKYHIPKRESNNLRLFDEWIKKQLQNTAS